MAQSGRIRRRFGGLGRKADAALPDRQPHCKGCPHRCPAAPVARRRAAGPVAQWLEPAAHNGLVAGSSPAGPTNGFNMLRDGRRQAARALTINPRTVCGNADDPTSKFARSCTRNGATGSASYASMIMTRLAEIDEVPSPAIKPIPVELLAPFLHGGIGHLSGRARSVATGGRLCDVVSITGWSKFRAAGVTSQPTPV